jgi:integrase
VKSYLEEDEVQQLEGAATNLRDKLIIRFLYRSGCRAHVP